MRNLAQRALSAIEAFSSRLPEGGPVTWSKVGEWLVMAAIGAGLWLLWYEDWLPKIFEEEITKGAIYFIVFFTAVALVYALESYLRLRAQRLGTMHAQMLAAALSIVVLILWGVAIAGAVGTVAWAIGKFYYWIGSEIVRSVAGDLEDFPSDIISFVAIMLLIALSFHFRHFYSWIGQSKNAGLIFAFVILVAPFTALQVIATLHLMWRLGDVADGQAERWWIIVIIHQGLNVLVATLLILLIVRAIGRLGALRAQMRSNHE